jgi:hypothetical protein
VSTRSPFLFFQQNQQYDTLLPISPCAHKLKAGIAYLKWTIVQIILKKITRNSGQKYSNNQIRII